MEMNGRSVENEMERGDQKRRLKGVYRKKRETTGTTGQGNGRGEEEIVEG